MAATSFLFMLNLHDSYVHSSTYCISVFTCKCTIAKQNGGGTRAQYRTAQVCTSAFTTSVQIKASKPSDNRPSLGHIEKRLYQALRLPLSVGILSCSHAFFTKCKQGQGVSSRVCYVRHRTMYLHLNCDLYFFPLLSCCAQGLTTYHLSFALLNPNTVLFI